MKRILHISPCFNYNCGRSRLVFLYLEYFNKKEGYEVHFITNGGDSLERLKKNRIDYKILNFSQGIKNFFYRERFSKQLKEYLVENRIELIHTHHRFPEYISVKTARKLNIKTVASAHSFVKGHKKISFQSDKIISVSNSLSTYLQKEFNVEKERLTTLYNPVRHFPSYEPREIISLKEGLGLNQGNLIILFMGRINYDKGYDVLMKSFNVVRNEFNQTVLILSGNIEDKNFRKISGKHNHSIKVIQSKENRSLLYAAADVVVLPSRIDPFPFVMIETGILKKPFIGGNTGGIAEFIENGKDGLLVQPGDVVQLADKIIYLLKNREYAKELGENLFKKVEEKCDYDNYFTKVEEIYNSLLV